MTNKIIKDVDALIKWFSDNAETRFLHNNTMAYYVDVKYNDIVKKINELTTTEPYKINMTKLRKAMSDDISEKRLLSLRELLKLNELKGGLGDTFINGYTTAINVWLHIIDHLYPQESVETITINKIRVNI